MTDTVKPPAGARPPQKRAARRDPDRLGLLFHPALRRLEAVRSDLEAVIFAMRSIAQAARRLRSRQRHDQVVS